MKIIEKYGFDFHKAAKTPWPSDLELPREWKPFDSKATKMYQKRSSSVNWLSTGRIGGMIG
jgi:hypothetical protein